MKKIVCVLLLSSLAFAQTVVPKPDPKDYSKWEDYNEAIMDWKIQQSKLPKQEPKCLTIQSCKAALKAEQEANRMLLDQLNASKQQTDGKDAKLKEQTELKKQYDDALAILDTLAAQIRGIKLTDVQQKALSQVQPGKAFDLGVSIEAETGKVFDYARKLQENYKNSHAAYASLVEKYNSTLEQANNVINSQNERLARQQRINNALALYSLMPKPQPVQLAPPPVLNSNTIHCTSNTIGSSTYTDCH